MFIPIDTNVLKSTKQIGFCHICEEEKAMWILNIKEDGQLKEVHTCALCILYKVAWGIKYNKEIKDLISKIEEKTETIFEKDLLNRLQRHFDADRVLAGIVAGNIFKKIIKK